MNTSDEQDGWLNTLVEKINSTSAALSTGVIPAVH
jgi:hypothetical protein